MKPTPFSLPHLFNKSYSLAKRSSKRAFTLVEIFVAIFVIIMLVGISIPNLSHYLTNEALRKTSREFKLLSRTAYLEAIQGFKATQIRLDPLSLTIVYKESPESALKTMQFANGVNYEFKYWEDSRWRVPIRNDEENQQYWTFDPSGLCEPLQIRFTKDESWIELTMDPLTGNPSDEAYYLE